MDAIRGSCDFSDVSALFFLLSPSFVSVGRQLFQLLIVELEKDGRAKVVRIVFFVLARDANKA